VRLEDLGNIAIAWTRRDVRLWQLAGLGFLVSLAIVGPTFWWEENWSGAPLIDRGGFLWIFPSAIMALGFFLGGAVAGCRCRTIKVAALQGFAASTATIGVIFAADLHRRHVHGKHLVALVAVYWVGALCVAGLVSGLGATFGRARAVEIRRRGGR
jgi:hypothetical protein